MIVTVLSLLLAGTSGQSFGQVGVTDECQKDIEDVEHDIKDNGDDYTTESIAKARAELAAAKTNRLNPVKCRENLQDARQALREGKRDKKNKE